MRRGLGYAEGRRATTSVTAERSAASQHTPPLWLCALTREERGTRRDQTSVGDACGRPAALLETWVSSRESRASVSREWCLQRRGAECLAPRRRGGCSVLCLPAPPQWRNGPVRCVVPFGGGLQSVHACCL